MSVRLPTSHGGAAVAAAIVALGVAWGPASAQSIDGYVELTATRTDDTTQNAGFEPIRTDTDTWSRRASFEYGQRLFPNLRLTIGGFFEDEDTTGTLEDFTVDSGRRQYRPYGRLRLTTQQFRGEVGFDRTDTRDTALGFESRQVRDTLASTAGWYPNSANWVQLRYTHQREEITGTGEASRTLASTFVDSFSRPTPWLTLQFRSAYDVVADDTLKSRTESNSTNFRVSYAQNLWDSRLSLASDYIWTRIESRQRSQAGTDVDVRVFPAAGLAAIDDTPDRDPLGNAPALLDGDRSVGAGINLGLQPGDDRRRNFGFDLGVPVPVSVVHVWVDRELRSEIVQAFSWEIWTSDDNDLWTFRRALLSAPFGAFDDRFELAFEAVASRYVKIVVRPLRPTDPFAAEYPVIQVTELEAFERLPAGQNFSELARSSDRITFNGRVRILENHPLFYDLSYLRNSTQDVGASTSLVNGLTYAKSFNPVWSLTTRLSNERADSPDRPSQTTNFLTATVSATPLSTLSASLLVGGRRETIQGTDRDTFNAILTSTAILYRGVELSASLGGSRIEEATGRTTDATLVNVSANVMPHPAITFGVIFQDNSRVDRGGGLPEVDDPNRALELNVTLNPVPTLYMFASRRVEERSTFRTSGDPRRTLNSYVASWSPFPYGRLHFSLTWNETYDTDFDAITRIWGPSLRWDIRPRWYLDLSYRDTWNDSDLQRIDRQETYATLHLGF